MFNLAFLMILLYLIFRQVSNECMLQRSYFLLTFGCQMNKSDSERIAGFLHALGLELAEKPEDADLLIINTCSVRQASEDRVYGFIHNWNKLRAKKPDLVIAITGCMPGRDHDGKMRKKLPGVDLFFGIDELPRLPGWLGGLWGITEWLNADGKDYLNIVPERQKNFQSFVTIQTGCNNFCTYCVVPYARGRERNRSVVDILSEIKKVVGEGSKEIMLLGQVVNHYVAPDPESFSKVNPFCHFDMASPKGYAKASRVSQRVEKSLNNQNLRDPSATLGMTVMQDDFAALLWEINQISGDFRINWTAADPQYFSDAQIEALKLPKQVNYLHLPVQSGDNDVLKKMNRHYTREKYLEIIKKIRLARPEMALGTDLVLGFSGESEEQFQNTVDLFKQCDFDIAYQSMYSERSGTAAVKAFKDDVPKVEKKRRWQVIQDLMEANTYRKNQKYLQQTVEVLVDKCEQGTCSGASSEMKLVHFAGTPDLVGKLVKIKITQAETWVIKGVLV